MAENRPFVIRDPVHGYIQIAAHERLVVDHPVTQRLRRVNQTGLAELVFPEARTSRFAHSLGAMHLASRVFVAAVENAKPSVAQKFLDDLLGLERMHDYSVDLEDFDALQITDADDGGVGLASARLAFRSPALRDPKYRRVMGLLEAAVRLAALFHDLGHLPFSHDFELALRDAFAADKTAPLHALASTSAPHEEIGHKLAHLVFRGLVRANAQRGVAVAYQFARDILNKTAAYGLVETPQVDALGWLHSLIDGEIDADRADFLLRDGRALGFDFAHYDLQRLLDNVLLVHDGQLGYITAVREHGLSAAESFLVARARSYQAFARHHKVVQIAAALRHCTAYTLGRDTTEPFRADLAAITGMEDENAAQARELLRRFAEYDDAWWLSALRTEERATPPAHVRATLGLVLRRERVFHSVWKRKGDVPVDAVNALVDGSALISFEETRRRLAVDNILAVTHRFKAYGTFAAGRRANESILLIQSGTTLTPISVLSPLVRSLSETWRRDLHLHVFAPLDIAAADVRARLGLH